jgi:hypothetical protein
VLEGRNRAIVAHNQDLEPLTIALQRQRLGGARLEISD